MTARYRVKSFTLLLQSGESTFPDLTVTKKKVPTPGTDWFLRSTMECQRENERVKGAIGAS